MGGKKKASKAPLKKESKYKIPNMYGCPLCDAKSCIVIRMVRRKDNVDLKQNSKVGSVRCRMCGASENNIPCKDLEKACDVYFRFRDKVQNADRAYLRKSGIQSSAANDGVNSLQMVLGQDCVDESHLTLVQHQHGLFEQKKRRRHTAAEEEEEERQQQQEEDSGHFFAAPSSDGGDDFDA